MNYRQIIGEAWHFTQDNKKLIVWYAFIPSLLSTVVGVVYLIYQFYAFKSSALFDNWSESFTVLAVKAIFDALKEHLEIIVPLTIAGGIVALCYFLLPPIADGAMIQLIARKKGGQDVHIRDGLKFGLLYFLPLLAYSAVAKIFNIFTTLTGAGYVLRNLGPNAFMTFLPLVMMILIVDLVLMMLFVFAEYYIVIDDSHMNQAIAKSAVLVFKNIGTAFRISVLMFIIGIRILLQIVFVLLVPMGVLIGIYYFAASTVPDIGLLIAAGIGVAALFFASYLGAIVHVFTTTVWVFAFLHLTTKPEINARGDVVALDPEEN